jgi:pilus assembly protein Flp/PilA
MKTPLGSIGPAYANWRNAIAAGEAIYPGEADAASRVPELTQIGLPIGTFCVWRIPGPRRIIDQEREKDRGQEDVKMSELMTKLRARILTLMISDEGQNLVEYAMVVAMVAFGATSSLKTLGTGLNHAFSNISSTLASSLT